MGRLLAEGLVLNEPLYWTTRQYLEGREIAEVFRFRDLIDDPRRSRAPDGPPPNSGLLVQTGLMIFLMVLDRSDCADGLVWTIGPNGPPMEFSMWNI